MKVFLDTNVVVDFCVQREEFFKPAAQIIDLAISGEIELVISSLTFINVAYIVRKAFGKDIVFGKLQKLSELCNISEIDEHVIKSSIAKHSKDFEDCVQCFSAMKANSDLIITRNKNDFEDLPLKTMTPTEFIEHCTQ